MDRASERERESGGGGGGGGGISGLGGNRFRQFPYEAAPLASPRPAALFSWLSSSVERRRRESSARLTRRSERRLRLLPRSNCLSRPTGPTDREQSSTGRGRATLVQFDVRSGGRGRSPTALCACGSCARARGEAVLPSSLFHFLFTFIRRRKAKHSPVSLSLLS